MSLKKFQSKFANTDLQRPNRYRVAISGPMGSWEQVNMFCEQAQFPGQNMRTSTDDLRHGPVREIVHGTTYGPINLTFLCTTGMEEKKWFENWQTYMVERSNSIMWQARYYKEYVGQIEMYSLDRADKDTYKITIFEAFPKTITAQEFSYGSQNDYQRVSVEFAYHHWVAEPGEGPSNTSPSLRTPEVPELNEKKAKTQTDSQMGASDRHPPLAPLADEVGFNVVPVPNPADQSFFPSPGQPVNQTRNQFGEDVGDSRNQ